MDRERAYMVEDYGPGQPARGYAGPYAAEGQQARGYAGSYAAVGQQARGYAGPYSTDIPMEQFNPDYEDDSVPRDSRWNGGSQPAVRRSRPRSEGFDRHSGLSRPHQPTWAPGDDLRQQAELLESLPSRQLEAMVSSGKHTLRHRRHKSFHGTLRFRDGVDATEEIGRKLETDPEMEGRSGEEIGDMIREMPTNLTSKRELKRRMSSRKKKRPGRFTQLKYSCGMGWQHFKYQVAEVMYSLELWRSHLKKIEGHFGTGITSYFLFLKWLFLINIPIFLLTFGFVVIPQILHRWYPDSKEADILTAYPSNNVTFSGQELLTGDKWFENTELYYGFYTSSPIKLLGDAEYKMIYAYLFTCGGYYLLCLLILAHSILRSYRKYYIEGSSEINTFFVNKVFCGWDYGITSAVTAGLKHKSVHNELLEFLSGKKEKKLKSLTERCQVFWVRLVTNLLVLGILGGSGYLIYYISFDENIKTTIPVLGLLALPLVITSLNRILPAIFSLLETVERYEKPKNELYIHMLRTMTLRATNLAVLVYFWFSKAQGNKTRENECWETVMGQEIFRLVIVDFIFTLLHTFFFEFIRRLIAQYCCHKITRAEFSIGSNTLDLIYSQALCWLGTFYSPLLSFIVIVKLWIIFYVKRISVLQNCAPSMRPWRAARSHTIFLGFLFCFFLLATAAVICGIIFIKPSESCGPYQGKNNTYQVVTELVDSWKDEYEWLQGVVTFISSPGFIAGLVVLLCMGTYYMRIAMIGHKEMVSQLQQQLALEGKDKNFLLNLLQEVSKRNKTSRQPVNKRITLVDEGSNSSFSSPGGRKFIRQMAETSARL